ncbi:MAG: HU family DNA-binding protein [Leptospirales bacterium]
MSRNAIVEYVLDPEGGDALPRKTIRHSFDFAEQKITKSLLSGKSVQLTGSGTFDLRRRADDAGMYPKIGEPRSYRALVFLATSHFSGDGVVRNRPSREAVSISVDRVFQPRSSHSGGQTLANELRLISHKIAV